MFSLKTKKNGIILTLILIIALFMAINIYLVLTLNNYYLLGNIEKADNDDVKYIRSAWTLLEKGIFTYHDVNTPTVYIMPGHTFVLAAFSALFGKHGGITAFRLFQVILQALALVLVFLIGRTAFNSRVGLAAAFLNALYLPEMFASGLLLTEIEFKFFFILFVYITFFAIRRKKKIYYISGGIIWGIACLFRPTIVLYPAVVFFAWLIYKYKLREFIKYTLITSAVFAVVLSPWWVRNFVVFDRFIPLTLSSGNPFLQGTYMNYDQTIDYTEYTPDNDAIKTNEIEMKTGIYRFKTYIKKYPLKYIYWYTIGKTWHLWKHPFYWKTILGIPLEPVKYYHNFILLMCFLGAIQAIAKRNKEALLIILVILYYNLIHLPFFTFSRYSYPVMPFIIVLAAYGIIRILTSVTRKIMLIPHKKIRLLNRSTNR